MTTDFYYPSGSVYILENIEAERVKVGMTGTGVNNVVDRLKDINDMWLERKVTCQVCGGRLVNVMGLVPRHVKSGITCLGGDALPLEKDVMLAETHLKSINDRLSGLFDSEKGSAIRRINTLKKRIERYRYHHPPLGEWKFRVAFHTKNVAEVESLSHQILTNHLDKRAPFGEVFNCTVAKAIEAIETALSQLGLLSSARKSTEL